MKIDAPTPLPMTVVIGKNLKREAECIRAVEVWDTQAVAMNNAEDMSRLGESFEPPAGPDALSFGFQGVAFRFLVKRGNDWHQSAMTIPYYQKEGRGYDAEAAQGFTCAQDVMDYASSFIDYIHAQASGKPVYQGEETRFEAIKVTSHVLPLLSPIEGVATDTLRLVERLGKEATRMELADETKTRSMIGFVGIAGLEPLSASSPSANPRLSCLTALEVTDHGLPVGAYIRGALGENVLVPKRLQSSLPADNLLDRLASRRSMDDSAKPSFVTPKTPKG